MKKLRSYVSILLLLCLLPSLFPMITQATNAEAAEEKPVSRGVTISSVSVPTYSGGTASSWMTYDGGDSVSFHDGEYRSKMQIIKGTTATQYNTYCTKLTDNGYTKVWSRTLAAQSGSNRYAKFLAPDGSYSIYTYFTPYSSQTRIIVDTHKDTVEGFYYDGKGSDRTEVYMYNLTAPDNGYAYTSSDLGIQRRFPNGSMFVIKMPDNSLFIIDGGHKLHMGERAMDDLYDFCRQITGIPEGQKMIISAWHLSHVHTDHSDGFGRFLTKYSHRFDLKNIIYNTDYVEAGCTQETALHQIAQLFPNARYYKPHTGERFKIAGVTFDVLYTAEDWYKPNSSNKLVVRDTNCLDYSNDNNASMALRMSFDGKTALWLGDLEKNDAELLGMYPAADLKSDILQLPHHLLDDHTTLVKTILPSVSFANQSWQASQTRGKIFNYMIKIADYAGDIYYAGNETVGYCAAEGVFYRKDHLELDYGNWTPKTYDLREANPVTSEAVKANEQFYRYMRAKELASGLNAYAIVDHKTDWILSYDAINGGADRALPAYYIGDTLYFAASQRRFVNWQIQYGSFGTNENAVIPNYGNYLGVTINKGTGDYWGTTSNKNKLYLGYNDTFVASGMYSSWSGMSNQLETSSKGVWIDKMAAGTCLIYRYDNGTYYPLYRDGDILSDNGWGTAKLTYSQARNKCAYLKTRLYKYETTPSDMMISFTGHSDYYVYPGVPQAEIISHIVSDLRVNYTLPAFNAKGEIFYDASLTKEPGTYRLEFTKTLSPNTVGDYPAKIRYVNPNGTIQDLGTVTVHVEARNPLEDGGAELFFGFSDDPTDKLRYRLEPQYNYFNFDSDKRWTAAVYDNDNKKYTASSYEVNPHEGTMEIVVEDKTSTRKIITLDLFAGSRFPLKYDPQYAEVVQIRLKLENFKGYGTSNPFLRFWYYGTDQERHFDEAHYFGANYQSDGEYVTITLDLYDQAEVDANASASGGPTMRFCDMDEISSIRLGFYYLMVNDASKNGSILIDHIYIGPKDGAPVQEQSMFFDFGNTEADQLRYTQESYKGYNFDLAPKAPWVARETSTTTSAMTNFTIDNSQGVVKIPVAEDIAYEVTSGLYGPWFLTAAIHGTHPNNTMPSTMALSYDPAAAEYVQLRFKTEGCVNAPGRNAEVITIYDRTVNGVSDRGGYDIMDYYKVENGKWITMTIPVSREFKTAEYINSFGVRFRSIKAESKGSGRVVLDYLFAGPRSELPNQIAILKFTSEDGTVLETLYHPIGSEAVFSGPLPTKPADENGPWNFVGWMDETGTLVDLKTVSKDSTLKPCFSQGPSVVEGLNIYHSLNLASDIAINYMVPVADLQSYNSFAIRCEIPKYEGNALVGTETVTLQPELRNSYYYFTLTGLTAVHMNDVIEATLHMEKDGLEYLSETDSYSIAKYAYGQMDSATSASKLKILCAELLRYGSLAQSYKGYRTDSLADAQMTITHKSLLSDLDTVTFENNRHNGTELASPSVTWLGKALDLNTKVTVLYVINVQKYTGDPENLSLRVSYTDYNGREAKVVLTDPQPYNGSEIYYTFRMDSLLAAELRAVLTAQVYEGNTPVSNSTVYSADTYGNGKDGALGQLCKALFAYSDQAKNYFSN